MRKSVIIILTIAVLGLVGVYEKTKAGSPQLVSPSQTEVATSTGNNSSSSSGSASSAKAANYKNGSFTGDSEATPYGTVQIAVVVSGGKIVNVNFLQMPSDQRESQQRTAFSEPLLKQTTLDKQSASIDFVSGATQTSVGYQQSLQSALDQAAQA